MDNEKAVTVVNAGIGEPYGAFGLNNRMGESRLASLQEDMWYVKEEFVGFN